MPQSVTKIDLNAVLVALCPVTTGGADRGIDPCVVIDAGAALPSGAFGEEHPTLEQALRAWAGVPLGYVEQLYTFADRDRARGKGGAVGDRIVSIGYLALLRPTDIGGGKVLSPWYKHFPWEDHRGGWPEKLMKSIRQALGKWCSAAPSRDQRQARQQRVAINFPEDHRAWNDELVLQRYELLWEAGLMADTAGQEGGGWGQPLAYDHRRILATAMARLRAKIKYRPVVFELMPEEFTLLQLQMAVEALAGLPLHKQNFRRLVEQQGLVEETGSMAPRASGRPAKLFRFRREVLVERAVAGTKLARS